MCLQGAFSLMYQLVLAHAMISVVATTEVFGLVLFSVSVVILYNVRVVDD